MTLGEHLRADHDVHVTRGNRLAHAVECALAPGAVAIHADYPGVRIQRGNASLQTLRAEPQRQQVLIAAIWTSGGNGCHAATMMAAEAGSFTMQDHARRTSGAFGFPAAACA